MLSNYEAKACTCMGAGTVENEIKERDAVFVGTIIECQEISIYDTLGPNTTIGWTEMKYTIVLETVYRGRQFSDTAYIFTGSGGGDCGFIFQIGQKYIVYANHLQGAEGYVDQRVMDKKSVFSTDICTRTRAYDAHEINAIEKQLRKKKFKRKN